MRLSKKLISLAVTAAMLLFGVTPASATTGTWATPTDLTTRGERISDAAEIAVDSTGLATAVWTRDEGNGVDYTIRSSTSLNGGPWSTPINVSAVGEDNSEPKIAVDSTGLAIAVWVIKVDDFEKIQSSSRPRGGTWSTALDVSAARAAPPPNTPGMSSQSVAFDSTGLAIAVWNIYDLVDEKSIIQTSSRSLAGVWSGPSNLSNASENTSASGAKVAFNSSGVAFVVWETRHLTSNRYRAEIRLRSSEGTWSPISYVDSSLHHSSSPNVVVSSDGVVTIALVTTAEDYSQTVVESVIRQPNGTFLPSDRRALSDNLDDAFDLKLAAGLNGSTIAVWFAYTDSRYIIQSATRSGAGVISGRIDLSDRSFSANSPDLAIDGNGLATAVWEFYDGDADRIQSRTLQNGSWSSAEYLSAAGRNADQPKVAANTSGRTVVVWEHNQGPHNVVQSRASFQGVAWSNTANVSPAGRNSSSPRVVVDSNGLATILFQTNEYDSALGRSFLLTKSSTSFRGGAWSAPVTVSTPGEYSASHQLSVDANGLVTAVYFAENATSELIKSTTSFRGGAWSAPVTLSEPGHEVGNARVAADANGLATAVWRSYDGTRWLITSRTSRNGGVWSAPTTLNANSDNGQSPVITADSNGLATAIWVNNDGSNTIIQSSKSLNGGAWSAPVNLSRTGSSASEPFLSVNTAGLVSAVWTLYLNGIYNVIESSTSLGSGAWSNPQIISPEDRHSYDPKISVDSTGRSVAVWKMQDNSESVIQSKTRSSAGNWSSISSISTGGEYAYAPQISSDWQGLATAIWSTNSGLVQSSTSLSGSAWAAPVRVSALNTWAFQPTLAVDSNGLVTAAWVIEGNTVDFIQASSIQNTSPAQSTYSNWSGGEQNNTEIVTVVTPVPAFNIKPLAVAFGSKTLTIGGNNFGDLTGVKIAGKAAKIIQKQSGEIVVEVPNLAEGKHDVEITHSAGVITMQGLLQIVKPYELKRTQTVSQFKGNAPTAASVAALRRLYLQGTTANLVTCAATVGMDASARSVSRARAQATATCQAVLNFSVRLMSVKVLVSKTGKPGSRVQHAVTFDRTLTSKR